MVSGTRVPTFTDLRDELLAAMADGVDPWTDARFDGLALAIHRFQLDAVPVYRAWFEAAGEPTVETYRDIPALPITAFKRFDVQIDGAPGVATWASSSTTGQGVSRHCLPDLALYDASLRAGVRAALLPEAAPLRAIQLAAPARVLPHSSLTHMLDAIRCELAAEDGGTFADATTVDVDAAWSALEHATSDDVPVIVLATSFALVQLFDGAPERAVELPAGSRAMDTGGYKGRTRELTRDELVATIGKRLGIPAEMCENEYGMSELSSQAYLGTIARTAGTPLPVPAGARWQVPWMRTHVVDPVTLDEVADGETGLLVHHDLANLGSCAAIRSEDVGVRIGSSYAMTGRAPAAALRGCSLPLEAIQ